MDKRQKGMFGNHIQDRLHIFQSICNGHLDLRAAQYVDTF